MPTAKGVPDGYHSVQPYLMFKNTSEAIDFYKKAFGATERLRMQGPDGRIGHAEIQVGDSCVMMADEAPSIGALSVQHYGGSPVSLMIYVEDCDAAFQQAIAAGAKSLSDPSDKPYGERMGSLQDPFGFHWHLGTRIKDMTIEELENLKM